MPDGRSVTIAVTQMACSADEAENIAGAEAMVREATAKGANIILIQELFATPYFCKDENPDHFELAQPFEDSRLVAHFSALARELNVVLPISFFERAGQAHFNSLAMIDADGTVLGRYRKSHIPDGPGYEEKYYFSPGDTGFKVWKTAFGTIGVAICWDQWFPEAARAMALMGAEILLYPTAIGSEPLQRDYDSAPHWQMVMRGHAAANMLPVAASNRIGTEPSGGGRTLTFYGSSFIADWTGQLVACAARDRQEIVTATFNLDEIARLRRSWGLFRDRRPDLYGALATLDGTMK